jgi:hypothetical protein
MQRTRKLTIIGAQLWVFLSTLVAGMSANAIEEPAFEVRQRWDEEQIEIREYAPRVMAVTEMAERENDGFRVLAGYIFGGNAREQEIAMTAPVQQTMSGPAEMAFMMPAEYAFDELPEPNDARVAFRQAPAYTAAVIRFSGWANAEKADANWQKLRGFLIKEGIEIVGEPTLNQYNPPWTLGFLRRNEIIVPVKSGAPIASDTASDLS